MLPSEPIISAAFNKATGCELKMVGFAQLYPPYIWLSSTHPTFDLSSRR